MRRFLFATIGSLIIASAFGADITVEQILSGFDTTLGIPSIQGSFKIQLVSRKGDTREIEARAYQKQSGQVQNNRLFVFDFPPSVRGTSLLLNSYFDGRQNNMWIYLPAVKRVKRVALESSGGGFFMGSDFTYRDLINNDNSKLKFERLPDEVVQGQDSYAIKAQGETTQIQQEHGYSYIVSYYRKDNMFLHSRRFFDFNGELLKIYLVEDFRDFNPYLYPTKISMTNVQNGHKSIITVSKISTEDIDDEKFTTRFLQNN